jgi:hypothetical protein
MLNRSFALLVWLINLFAPPPLASMSVPQKIGRAFLVTLTLVISCILAAMVGGIGIFVVQRGHDMMGSVPELLRGLEIIFAGACVNVICVAVLLQIKRADRKLIPECP